MIHNIQAGYYRSRHFFSTSTSKMRTVDQNELEIVKTGTGFSYVSGAQYPHAPGRILLALPGDTRFTMGSYECFYLKFKCDDGQITEPLRSLPRTAVSANTYDIERCISEAAELVRSKEETDQFKLYSLVFSALSRLSELLRINGQSASNPDLRYFDTVIAVKEYIDSHYSEQISLELLSEKFFLSKNFLRIKFKEYMGISSHKYLGNVRLSYAKKLLRTTEKNISQIAFECGYESQVYFNYCFREQVGVSPLKYRRGGDAMRGTFEKVPQPPQNFQKGDL